MPEDHNKELPSIEELIGQTEELPSVEDYLVQENIQEETQIIDDAEGNPKIEVTDVIQAPEWGELLRLINDVRESIPEIPEIKTYDKELEAICEIIDDVKASIPVVPEVRYYEEELESIRESVQLVKESIPTLPVWIEKVTDVPDFTWVGQTFNTVDERFRVVKDCVETLSSQIENELNRIQEEKDILAFETKTDFKSVHDRVGELKGQIFGQLKEQSDIIWKLQKKLKENQKEFEIVISDQVDNKVDHLADVTAETANRIQTSLNEKFEFFGNKLDDEVEFLKTKLDNLPKPKYYEEELNKIKKELKNFESLREIVEQIQVRQENIEDLQENYLLTEPPDKPENVGSGQDPLTPLDQKFATLSDLASHYRIFINRIQTQLSTMGGGGAGFIKDLDDVDISGLADGYVLSWEDSTNKWKTIPTTGIGVTLIQQLSNVAINTATLQNQDVLNYDSSTGIWRNNRQAIGAAGTWSVSAAGIHTTKNVGIATTARPDYALYVQGDTYITGNISVAGTITYDDVTNVDSLGIITARQDVEVQRNLYVAGITTLGATNGIGTVTVGVGSTALLVDGDARVIGILTIGRASITLDGNNPSIQIGETRLSATGINSAPNVIYVAKDGNDSNNGTSIDNAFLTIAAAVGVATTGTTIKVKAGNYLENNPIEVPAFVSIVGDDLKTVTVSPNTANDDLFHVRKGCYLGNMTFTNHVAPAAAVAFPTTGIANNQDGGIWESPYIQNCTSNTTTGTGLRIDGNQAELLKSMVCDSYTQYNQGGVGVAVTNGGFAQLVSVFTICCNEAITCDAGGQVDLTNSNSSFGTYGLVARGVGIRTFTSAVAAATTTANQNQIAISGLGTARPYDGQGVYFDQLYQTITSITLTNAGTGYTATPNVIIDLPSGPNGAAATAFATLDGDTVSTITLVSGGNQFASAPTITIDAPTSGTQATATASMEPIYYTVTSSTPTVGGISTVTLEENLNNAVSAGTTAYFHQLSRIVASSHTFEYVGSGNTIQTATPIRGGVTIQENEVFTDNGGRVVYTSTDQAGNFRIGDNLQINQNTGTISGRAFTRSLFSEMTPFILALS